MKKIVLRNQKGFTLIEIIAVLVILGILAAVAIPRYFGMQEQAADKVADAAVASAYSALSTGWAADKMNSPNKPASPVAACTAIQLEGSTLTSVGCTGATWPASGGTSTITVTYTGGTSGRSPITKTWIAP